MKTVAQTVIGADHFYTIAAHTGNVIQAVEGVKGAGTVRLGRTRHPHSISTSTGEMSEMLMF